MQREIPPREPSQRLSRSAVDGQAARSRHAGYRPVVPGAAKTVCDEAFGPRLSGTDAGLNPALLIVSEFFCSSSISRS